MHGNPALSEVLDAPEVAMHAPNGDSASADKNLESLLQGAHCHGTVLPVWQQLRPTIPGAACVPCYLPFPVRIACIPASMRDTYRFLTISPVQPPAEEAAARVKAEAEAQDRANRLRVAQEQMAEYASQKEADTNAILQQAAALEAALSAALGSAGSDVSSAATEQLRLLKQRLSEAAAEAAYFANQQVWRRRRLARPVRPRLV